MRPPDSRLHTIVCALCGRTRKSAKAPTSKWARKTCEHCNREKAREALKWLFRKSAYLPARRRPV